MHQLNKIVIPQIKPQWDEVAEALELTVPAIEAIRQKGLGDPRRCCKEFLTEWLTTKSGKGPKVWETLLEAIEDTSIDDKITQEIRDKVSKLK